MNIQVLVATMHQKDHSLLKKMNIQTDVIVANQCAVNAIEDFTWMGHNVKYLNFAEKGVGLNRNNALMRASGDICLFADDDMCYIDGYHQIVQNAFKKYVDADVIIFNLIEHVPIRYIIKKDTKVNFMNYMRYGTARLAIKLKSIRMNAIYFNQYFGGGTKYCHGEDTLFLTECLKKRLKIYAVPEYIATLTDNRSSTWNGSGYDKKYLVDQGILYRAISMKFWKLLCLQDAIRRHYQYGIRWIDAYRLMTDMSRD